MREQIHKLKDEALVALRLQWMREGTDPSRPQVKGGQLLMQHTTPANNPTAAHAPANNELNVEVESGGAVRVIPPMTPGTNSPPQ